MPQTLSNVIQQGEVVKFIMAITRQDFSMATGNFQVELSWGLLGSKKVIKKADMLEAADGWVFSFDTADVVGPVIAKATWFYEDADVPGAIRPETDEQLLCKVAAVPCPRYMTCPACSDDHDVTYTRTEESDITAAYMRLVDVYDRPILTDDGEYIFVLRSELESNNE